MAENFQFLAKNSVLLENNRVGGTPLWYFEHAELKEKGFPLVFLGAKPLFMVFLCLYYRIQVRWCAALFCSTTP